MVYFEELLESVLKIPLTASEERREHQSTVTSCISTVAINHDHECLLTICCDDDLLDAALVKIVPYTTLNLKMRSSLNILNKLSAAISEGLIRLFKNEFYLCLLSFPVWLDDDIIVEGTMEHPSGCIRIVLTRLNL